MTTIKNFRITLRPREIARWLKRERQLAITPEVEFSIDEAIPRCKPLIHPAATYTTLTRAVAEKTTPLVFPETAVAVSVLAVSIGPEVEAARQNALAQQDTAREALMAGIQDEAVSQSFQFAARLVQDQAKDEDCEMSSSLSAHELSDDQHASTAATLSVLLGIQRVGISLDAAASTLPPYARLSWIFWLPLVKNASRRGESSSPASRSAAGSAAGKPGGRSEKVTA